MMTNILSHVRLQFHFRIVCTNQILNAQQNPMTSSHIISPSLLILSLHFCIVFDLCAEMFGTRITCASVRFDFFQSRSHTHTHTRVCSHPSQWRSGTTTFTYSISHDKYESSCVSKRSFFCSTSLPRAFKGKGKSCNNYFTPWLWMDFSILNEFQLCDVQKWNWYFCNVIVGNEFWYIFKSFTIFSGIPWKWNFLLLTWNGLIVLHMSWERNDNELWKKEKQLEIVKCLHSSTKRNAPNKQTVNVKMSMSLMTVLYHSLLSHEPLCSTWSIFLFR